MCFPLKFIQNFRVLTIYLNIVVLDRTSNWFKETVKSLEASDKSLKIVVYKNVEPSPLASTSNSQRRASIVRPSGASKRPSSSSSSTPNQITPNDQAVVVIREEEASPPRKKSPAPSRNVARKHTHPIMRTAHLKKVSAPVEAPKSLPAPGSSGVKKGPSNTSANPLPTSSKTILVSPSSSSAMMAPKAVHHRQ